MKKATERRKYARVLSAVKVVYSGEGDTKQTRETTTHNISAGGVQIKLSSPPPVSMPLELSLYSPRRAHPIRAKGRVVWVEEVKTDKSYEVGIEFTEIKETDCAFIKKWVQTVDLDKILAEAVKRQASDIHFVAEQPPVLRIFGELVPLHLPALSSEDIKSLVMELLSDAQRESYAKDLDVDVSYMNEMGRFRVNIHQEKGQPAAVFRYIPSDVKGMVELRLPEVVKDLARKPNGLILVTGPMGSGKSTTLASMIEIINKEKRAKVISLEEPIEYLYKSKKSIIEQREVGIDTPSFVKALRYTVRQDVDVIMVGEIRDLTSIMIALTAAETGHLVLTTLHTLDTISSIHRIVEVFPANQQQQVRLQLAETLRGIISQILLPEASGNGRVVATEVLVCTPAVSNIIRRGKLEDLSNSIELGGQYGMHTMDRSLQLLYSEGLVTLESILPYAKDISRFT